ncbi:hypothetical protein CN346_27155, partial [Bacillus thuringiensis]
MIPECWEPLKCFPTLWKDTHIRVSFLYAKIIFKQKLFIKERRFVYNENERSFFYLGRNNSV